MWFPSTVLVSLRRTAAFSGLPAPSMTSCRRSVLFLRAASMRSSPGLAPFYPFVSMKYIMGDISDLERVRERRLKAR